MKDATQITTFIDDLYEEARQHQASHREIDARDNEILSRYGYFKYGYRLLDGLECHRLTSHGHPEFRAGNVCFTHTPQQIIDLVQKGIDAGTLPTPVLHAFAAIKDGIDV